jgi:hypothetical protein
MYILASMSEAVAQQEGDACSLVAILWHVLARRSRRGDAMLRLSPCAMLRISPCAIINSFLDQLARRNRRRVRLLCYRTLTVGTYIDQRVLSSISEAQQEGWAGAMLRTSPCT